MQVFDRFLPPRLQEDLGGLRRGRVLVGTAFCFAIATAIGLVLRLKIAAHHPAAIAIAIACSVLFAATPWLLLRTGSLSAAGAALLLGLLALVAGSGWVVGGLGGPILVAATLVPFVATFLLGPRAGALATLLTLAQVILFTVLPWSGVAMLSPPLSGLPEVLARAVMLGLSVAGAGFFAVLYEQQRVETEDRLRRSEDLYRRIFEHSQDIIALSTPQGALLDINRAGARFYGLASKAEIETRNVEDGYVDVEERRLLLDRLEREGHVQDYETVHRTPGGPRVLRGTTSTVRDERGAIECLLAILRDVTDERQAERQREALLTELAGKNEELEAFTYAVSHDLKSPLATARGFLHLLEKEALAGNLEKTRKYLPPIDRAAVKMSRMLEDLLQLSRIGRAEFEPAELALDDVAREALELVAGRIQATGTTVAIAPGLPRVHGDRKLFLAVFQNLVDNAVKFSAARPHPRVWIDSRDGGGATIVRVRDNGIGIAPRYHDKVFGVFQQLDPEAGGTGIGLANVKRAIEVHGCRVWIESPGEGRGTTFCFTVPALPALDPPTPGPEP